MKPAEFRYRLIILDVPEPGIFTNGGGIIYITRPVLDRVLDGTPRGESVLAFILAQQLGHMARLHCRRGWQLAHIEDDLKGHFKTDVDAGLIHRLLETSVRFSGPLTYFLYSRQQSYEADLFAWQLCRNAHFDPEEVLDALRYLALTAYPRLVTEENFRPSKEEMVSVLRYYLSESPEPLVRLKRCCWSATAGSWTKRITACFATTSRRPSWLRCGDRSVAADQAAIVFVHGLRGDAMTFRDFLAFLGQQKETASRPLLVFRYPNNDSLARSGLFLNNEIRPRACRAGKGGVHLPQRRRAGVPLLCGEKERSFRPGVLDRHAQSGLAAHGA